MEMSQQCLVVERVTIYTSLSGSSPNRCKDVYRIRQQLTETVTYNGHDRVKIREVTELVPRNIKIV